MKPNQHKIIVTEQHFNGCIFDKSKRTCLQMFFLYNVSWVLSNVYHHIVILVWLFLSLQRCFSFISFCFDVYMADFEAYSWRMPYLPIHDNVNVNYVHSRKNQCRHWLMDRFFAIIKYVCAPVEILPPHRKRDIIIEIERSCFAVVVLNFSQNRTKNKSLLYCDDRYSFGFSTFEAINAR